MLLTILLVLGLVLLCSKRSAITDNTSLTLSNFNQPLFLADVLTHMEDRLQMLGFINRQIEQSRSEWGLGNVIRIKKTANFTVQSTPFANMAAVETAKPTDVNMAIDQYRCAGMKMTDVEEAVVGRDAWNRHARRIGYALAVEVEKSVTGLFITIPHTIQIALSAITEAVLTKTNRIFQELGIPEDGPQMRRFVIDANGWEKFMGVAAFTQQQGAGLAGIATQTTGDLPEKFGLVPFQSNVLTTQPTPGSLPNTGGTETTAAPAGAAVVTPGGTKGATTITLAATSLTGTFRLGMVVQIGNTTDGLAAPTDGKKYRRQLYTVAADAATGSNQVTLTIQPPLRQNHETGSTWRRIVQATSDAPVLMAGGFYGDAFALAMVELPRARPGVNISIATNPNSGLSLRSREVYDPFTLEAALIYDCYYGVKTLDEDKAVRVSINPAA